ncbi:MAG: condensin subunit Smc [Actinomycetia bacterium]|nr:condensin subunit Smc [Actinomycetes bacterium]
MFLKSLTLRGFKSFADKTVLEFEPGVTVVVGPNGSGKSNLVDAVAWVLGAQGARALRGSKMDDVIFAGTPQRAALGRAEVSLTIDNSAGILPIEFTEVTITRTLFRTGDSEYQINGAPCRLLDIQELLSDSGIGRQQHVIIGQGQLDAILNSRPEDRRAIVEEAAGVLKFRKRREKAERRLEATEGNLLRLHDTLREVRRQLTPLAKQADAARRHDGLADELRAIRLHLAGHELAGLQARGHRIAETRRELAARDQELRDGLQVLDLAVLDAEESLGAHRNDELAEWLVRVEALRERARGLHALVAEKQRGLERELASNADEGVVETLVADAAGIRAELTAIAGEVAALAPELATIQEVERAITADAAALRAPVGPGATAVGPAPAEALAVLRRDLSARREAVDRSDAEVARLDGRRSKMRQRVDALAAEQARLQAELARAESAKPDVEARYTVAAEAHTQAEEAVRRTDEEWRAAEGEAGRWRARADALGLALETARAHAGADALAGLDGVVGPLVDHVEIEPGLEPAVVAALGDAMQAVVLSDPSAARPALEALKHGATGAWLLLADDSERAPRASVPGCRALTDCVRARTPGLDAALTRLLAGVVLVDGDWRRALDLALEHPGIVTVTVDGDRFGGRTPWRIGGDQGLTATLAAYEEAVLQAERSEAARVAAEQRIGSGRERLEAARKEEAAAESDRRANLSRLQNAAGALERIERERAERAVESEGVERELAELRARHEADVAAATQLAARLPDLEAAAAGEATLELERRRVRSELDARTDEIATRRRGYEKQTTTLEARKVALEQRLAGVEERLARHPEAQAEAERQRATLMARSVAYDRLARHVLDRVEAVGSLHERLREQRRIQGEALRGSAAELERLRRERAALEQELAAARERATRAEIDDAETRLRLEAAVETVRNDFDCEPELAIAAPAPDVTGGSLSGRARELDRELRLLGPINPLALEEYDALQERHEFLQQQLDDVKGTRKELARVIRAVDLEIVTMFQLAFADVAEHFTALFATLFPGGSGRVFLTDPDDPLNTGIEMEARPSGKNVRRLSLLSGGERSLTAMAFLFAVFRARPSPFFLLDEVEAALDDVNLHRFLDLVREFRNEAQLVVVSHQKRTMEAADCLYGVTMPPGGSSRVVSQKIQDVALHGA